MPLYFRRVFSSCVVPALLLLVACEEEPTPQEGPTYHQDVAPILAANCMKCHNPEGMKPDILFDDPETVQAMATMISGAVSAGVMPPFYAEETEDCPNPWGWKHDPRLSPEDQATLEAWAAAGGPIGDPATAAQLPAIPSTALQGADTTLFPTGKYTTNPVGEIEDEFVCFSIDPGLTEARWLEAYQVLPDNLDVVHHVLLGIDREGVTAEMVDANGVYPCFGGFGVPADFIGGWIPGASPTEYPPHSASRVPAGARLLLQMHYHLAGEAQEDGTGLELRWSDATPVREAVVGLAGNASEQNEDGSGLQPGPNDAGEPVFFVPAGVSGHTETMRVGLWNFAPAESEVFFVANHMHYIGVDMRMWVEGSSEESCLLQTPSWDFDWQQFYYYDVGGGQAPVVGPGDELWLQCEYDNTLDNPGVRRALLEAGLEQPVDVGLGEGSLDEMCIGIIGQVASVPLAVDEATHEGTLELETQSEHFAFTMDCAGPTSLRADAGGTVSGVAACGLDIYDTLYSVEVTLSGSMDAKGGAAGEVVVGLWGLEETATDTWTATAAADGSLSIPLQLDGIFAGGDVSFAGVLEVAPVP